MPFFICADMCLLNDSVSEYRCWMAGWAAYPFPYLRAHSDGKRPVPGCSVYSVFSTHCTWNWSEGEGCFSSFSSNLLISSASESPLSLPDVRPHSAIRPGHGRLSIIEIIAIPPKLPPNCHSSKKEERSEEVNFLVYIKLLEMMQLKIS